MCLTQTRWAPSRPYGRRRRRIEMKPMNRFLAIALGLAVASGSHRSSHFSAAFTRSLR
jgi:hypothetical protein